MVSCSWVEAEQDLLLAHRERNNPCFSQPTLADHMCHKGKNIDCTGIPAAAQLLQLYELLQLHDCTIAATAQLFAGFII